MTDATLIILSAVRREAMTLDAIEQRDRERGAYLAAQRQAPDRTRPLLVINNNRPLPAAPPAAGVAGIGKRNQSSVAGPGRRISDHAQWNREGELA